MDHVAVIDHMHGLRGCPPALARQGQLVDVPQMEFQPVVKNADPEPVADQPRGNGVEHLLEDEAAGRGDGDGGVLPIRGAHRRQVAKRTAFGPDGLRPAGIAASDDPGHEGAIRVDIGKVLRPPQRQGIGDLAREVAMRTLDGAVLVGHAAVVAGGRHPVMPAQRLIPSGPVPRVVLAEVAEGRRQAVGAVFGGNATQGPERGLQPCGQGREALAAKNHLRMAEHRPGEPEVIEPVIEGLSGHGDAESVHDREVRQGDPSRPGGLSEDHVPIRAVAGPPVADPPLEGAPDARIQVGMEPHQFPEHTHRPDVGVVLHYRHDVLVENPGQRIGAPPAGGAPVFAKGARVPLDPVPGGGAEAGLRGRRFGRKGFPVVYESPHLVISDMWPRHLALLFSRRIAR